MDPALTSLLAAALAFAAIVAIGFGMGGEGARAAGKRARAVVQSRKPGKAVEDATVLRRKQANAEALKELAERQRRSRRALLSVKGQIAQAGLKLEEQQFWIFSVLTGTVIGAGLFLVGAAPIAALAGFVGGLLGLPRWVLGFLIGRRQKIFLNQFADALDTIVRGVKSGLPLNQCMQIIANEAPDPLRSEFRAVCDGQAMGMPLDQNLQRMFDRMPLSEVNFFNIVLSIQQRSGGNLSEALTNLSVVLRSRKLLKEKIKAMSSEAKASAMIIGSLPFVVMTLVYIIRPDYIGLLFSTDQGRVILLVAGLMMSMGVFVMNRMVNFRI